MYHQRKLYGISEYDSWNLDYSLLTNLHNGLVVLYYTRHSYPRELTNEEWGNVLHEMIELIKVILQKSEDWEDYSEEYDLLINFLQMYGPHLWD